MDPQHEQHIGRGTLIGIFTAVCLWNFAIAVDSTSLATALSTIAFNLHATTNAGLWVGTSFVLCSAVVQPVFAALSSAVGRKPVILFALSTFCIGGIICGLSRHVATLLVGRSLQGIGAGGLTTMTYVIMADLLDFEERAKALGVISLAWLLGTCGGPTLGGIFAEKTTWRWNFWINMPFCGVCLVLVVFLMPRQHQLRGSMASRLGRFDWIGAFVFFGSLVSILLGLTWGGVMFAWSSWKIVFPLVLGVTGMLGWIAHSYFWSDKPMIPVQVLNNRTSSISYASNVVQGIAQFGVLYYLPLYYQIVLGYTPLMSGVGLLPQCVAAGAASIFASSWIVLLHRAKWSVIAGWICYACGLWMLTLLDETDPAIIWVLDTYPAGFGLGLLFTSLSMATQAAVECSAGAGVDRDRVRSTAAALNPFFRTLGNAFGIVIGQAVFTNEVKRSFTANGVAAGDVTELFDNSHVSDASYTVGAVVAGLRATWWTFCGMAGSCLLLTLLTKDATLELHRMREQRQLLQQVQQQQQLRQQQQHQLQQLAGSAMILGGWRAQDTEREAEEQGEGV